MKKQGVNPDVGGEHISDDAFKAEIDRMSKLNDIAFAHQQFDVAKRLHISVADLKRLVKKAKTAARDNLLYEIGAGTVDGEPSLSFGPYAMRSDGLFFAGDEGGATEILLCGPMEILARTRSTTGWNWGVLLRWWDEDGRAHEWALPMSALDGDGGEVRKMLLGRGLYVTPNRGGREKLNSYLLSVKVNNFATAVSRIGWHTVKELPGPVFVLPDASFGDSGNERVLAQDIALKDTHYNVSGTPEEWRERVAKLCIGNSRLVLAVSMAFAAPLLDAAGEPSGEVNLKGFSQTGKSTALYAAGSVCGGGAITGFVETWRATSNGLEATAEAHCDMLLPLDEMGQVSPIEAGEIAYMLANNRGKARGAKEGGSRRAAQWRVLFLSSGELSVADKMREAGKIARAGQEVRLIDVPADAGAGHGLFENLHGKDNGAEFSRHVREQATRYYGSPIRSYLTQLVAGIAKDQPGLTAQLKADREDFIAKYVTEAAKKQGQIVSVAGRFALIAAAGELATTLGITGWPEGEA